MPKSAAAAIPATPTQKTGGEKKKKNVVVAGAAVSHESSSSPSSGFLLVVNFAFGYFLCGLSGIAFAYYMFQLHETRLWFSNIKQVEKEISFRTEAGLYYSYFKEILLENDLFTGVKNLLTDSLTEAPHEINILQRMNVYQEIILAFFYRILTSAGVISSLEPITFYTYACFALSGLAVSAAFLLSWKLSGHFLFGLLTAAWTFADIDDSTRVFFTVNLREIFALPFFWLQNLAVLSHLTEAKANPLITLWTFLFSIFWQFNQFILFLQSLSLLAVAFCFPESSFKIIQIFLLEIFAFGFLLISQFFQPMLFSSVFLWLNVSSIFVLTFFKPSNLSLSKFSLIKNALIQLCLITCLTLAFSNLIKWHFEIEADSHIWTFVKAKLGIPITGSLPFETALYICHGAFAFIDNGFFERTSAYGMLPIYCGILLIVIGFTLKHIFTKSTEKHEFFNESLIFLVGQSILMGIMAILTLRMKYVWFPQIAILASHGFKVLDKWIGRFPKYVAIIGIIWLISTKQYAVYQQQIANEQEFYDPDTVALMEWISGETSPESIFAGSMQLLAGVKACTSRPIANHPHFEDKSLRERTERIYKIYGKYSIADVLKMACTESINFLILEDSICLSPSKDGCSTNEIIDNSQKFSSNIHPSKERFCEAVKAQTTEIKKKFKLVFQNQTFRVYRVLC